MAIEYSDLLSYWPIIIAAVITLLAIKSIFFKGQRRIDTNDVVSVEFLSNVIQEIHTNKKTDNRRELWLSRARKTGEKIQDLKGETSLSYSKTELEFNSSLNIKQKLTFSWSLLWIGITCFFIVEMILDPIIWGRNWTILPYFFYYIGFGVIFFLKR